MRCSRRSYFVYNNVSLLQGRQASGRPPPGCGEEWQRLAGEGERVKMIVEWWDTTPF